MPKCRDCGSKGILLKVNSKGLCSSCELKNFVNTIGNPSNVYKKESLFEKVSVQVLERYKNKLHDSTSYTHSNINLYYEECIEEAIQRIEKLDIHSRDEAVNLLNKLDEDIISIIYNMSSGTTLAGCKELLNICCQYMILVNGTSIEKETMEVIHVEIFEGFQINNESYKRLHSKIKEATTSRDLISQYSTSHYFHQLEFFINLYYVYGSDSAKGCLNLLTIYIYNDIKDNSTVVIAYKIKEIFYDKFERYHNYITELSKIGWTPPNYKYPTTFQAYLKNM